MNTKLDSIASFVATAVWADGVYEDSERQAVNNIASSLEIEASELSAKIETAINAVSGMDETAMAKYLVNAAANVDPIEAEIVFAFSLEIVLADGLLTSDEVELLMVIASALNISDNRAILLIADKVKEEKNLEVEL